jgi:hypothetical protein
MVAIRLSDGLRSSTLCDHYRHHSADWQHDHQRSIGQSMIGIGSITATGATVTCVTRCGMTRIRKGSTPLRRLPTAAAKVLTCSDRAASAVFPMSSSGPSHRAETECGFRMSGRPIFWLVLLPLAGCSVPDLTVGGHHYSTTFIPGPLQPNNCGTPYESKDCGGSHIVAVTGFKPMVFNPMVVIEELPGSVAVDAMPTSDDLISYSRLRIAEPEIDTATRQKIGVFRKPDPGADLSAREDESHHE